MSRFHWYKAQSTLLIALDAGSDVAREQRDGDTKKLEESLQLTY
jgi:hypothetical protein